MKKIILIDNYDSFTYNLVHLLNNLPDVTVDVVRNDKVQLEQVKNFEYILISPGPGIPNEAGLTKSIIKKFAATKNILGICLGHQAITEVFGGTLINMDKVVHGHASAITIIHQEEPLFTNIPDQFLAGRYHSWMADIKQFPKELRVTATDENGNIMALSHKQFNVKGLQFHPESILTPSGKEIINNWINYSPQ